MKETQCPSSGSPCAMQQEIRDIHNAVCVNDVLGHRGLVKRVDALEQHQNKAIIWGATLTGGAFVAWEWVRTHFKM